MTTSEAIKFMTRRCVYFQWRLSRVICQPPRTAHPPTWRAHTFNPVWCLSLANDITGLAIMPRSPYYQSFNDEIITTSSVLLRPFSVAGLSQRPVHHINTSINVIKLNHQPHKLSRRVTTAPATSSTTVNLDQSGTQPGSRWRSLYRPPQAP